MTNRQNEIIKESITLIAEKGIQGLTIKNLAKAINVTEPALYRHFENKTAILLAILDSFKNLIPNNKDLLLLENTTSIEKIYFIFNKYFEKFSANPEFVSVIFSDEIFKNDKKLSKKIAHLMNRNEDIFCNIIKSGQENNEIRNDIDSKHIAIIIMGSLRLLVKKWELSSYRFNLKIEGNNFFNSIKLMISTIT
jgi:AcrR family transcriptional regulator